MRWYFVRPATSDDLDVLMRLRLDAEDWLREADIRQWTEDYADHGHQVLRESVDRGDAWLVTTTYGTPAGTITLNGPDLDFWQTEDDPDDASYVYKMIVARAYAGHGLGDALLNWASRRAEEAGRSWLRLDCRRDNHRLHAYYTSRGFDHVRTVWSPPRPTNSGALFKRPAGSVAYGPIDPAIERATVIEEPRTITPLCRVPPDARQTT